MSDFWNDPDLTVGGDYIKFDEPGTTIAGKVLSISKYDWGDGTYAPQLILDTDDGEKTVTAGQVRLKALLAETKPQPGDVITIVYVGTEPRPGGKTLKNFTVDVIRATNTAAAPPAASVDALAAAQALQQQQG